MRIVVLVKEVPDTYGKRTLDLETGLSDRGASDKVTDEISERATEIAVSYAESQDGTEVTLISVGPESASNALRKGLSMGAHRAFHVLDDELIGADLTLTSEVVSKAVEYAGFDLVIMGNQSTDGTGGILPSMVAEHLRVPHLSALNSMQLNDQEVIGTRSGYDGELHLQASLPAVISITDRFPDPRYPGFKGIMAAKKKPLTVVNISELGVEASISVPRSIMTSVNETPPRAKGIIVNDEGDAGNRIAEYLIEKGFA